MAIGNHVIWKNQPFVIPEMFGAKGDGITDDTQALYDMHVYANEEKKKVVYSAKEYAIKQNLAIPIKTNTDFSNAKLIVDEAAYNDKTWLFEVLPSTTSTYRALTSEEKSDITNGWTKNKNKFISFLSEQKNKYIIIETSDVFCERKSGQGSSGGNVYIKELMYINHNGFVMGDYVWALNNPTNIKIVDAERERLVITGCEVVINGAIPTGATVSGNYQKGFMTVKRCRTTIDGFFNTLADGAVMSEKYVMSGFLNINDVFDVEFKNMKLLPRRVDTSVYRGTYCFSYNNSMNIKFINCEAVDDRNIYWGSTTGSYLKNLYFEKCKMNRLDVHFWVHDLTIRDCEVHGEGIQLTGTGKLLIENTHVDDKRATNPCFLTPRTDYSSLVDMDIIIRDCKYTINSLAPSATIIDFEFDNSYDSKSDKILGRSITIQNLEILPMSNTTDLKLIYFNFADIIKGGYSSYLPHKMNIENINVQNSNELKLIDAQKTNWHKMKEYGSWNFKSIKLLDRTLTSTAFGEGNVIISGGNTPLADCAKFDIVFDDIKNLRVSLNGNTSNATFNNCSVVACSTGGDANNPRLTGFLRFNDCILGGDYSDTAYSTSVFNFDSTKTYFNSSFFTTPKKNGVKDVTNARLLYRLITLSGTPQIAIYQGNHILSRFETEIMSSTCFVVGGITTQQEAIDKFKLLSH